MSEGNEQAVRKYLTFMAVRPGDAALSVTAAELNEFWTAAAKVIAGFGGVVRVLPEQILHAIFGFDEDNQEYQGLSASLCAQKLQDMVRDRFALHIALHGDYIAGTKWGSDSLLTSTPAQKVISLCNVAGPGQVFLSQQAYETVKTQAMTRTVKMIQDVDAEIMPVHSLIKTIGRNDPLFYLRHTLNQTLPLIGRDREFDIILGHAASAFKRESCHLHVEGEAGSGKTRLVYSAIDHLLEEYPALAIFASPSGQSFSEGNSIQDFLRDVCSRADLDFKNRSATRDAFIELGLTNDLFTCAYLDVHRLKGVSSAWSQMPVSDQQHFQAELAARILAHLSRSYPVIVLFDDIHKNWSYAEILVQSLQHNFHGNRIFILSVSKKQNLILPSSTQILKLEILPEQKIREIVRLSLADTSALGHFEADIVKRANGNPYFALQLVRHIQKENSTRQQTAEDIMPSNLDSLFALRIQKMDRDLRDVLSCCAVLGQKFLINHVIQVLGEAPAVIDSALRQLEDQGLIRFSGSPSGVGEFTHDLAQECIYRALPTEEKEKLHRKTLTILRHAQAGSICERPSRMAHHAFYAGLYARAYAYGYAAGVIDLGRSLPSQAEKNLSLALIALRRMSSDIRQDVRLARTLLNLSKAQSLAGRPQESLDAFGRIPLVKESADFIQQKIQVETSIKWTLADYTLDKIKAIEARINPNSRMGIGNILRCAGMLADIGLFEESNQRIHAIFPAVQKLEKKENCGLLFPAVPYCLANLSRNYAELGKQYQAHECAISALEEVEHLMFSPKRVYALAFSAVHYQKQGQHEKAVQLLKEAYFLTKEFQIGMIYPYVACNYAYSLYFTTHDPAAFSIMRSGLDYAEQRSFYIRRSQYNLQYAEIMDAAGRKNEAVKLGLTALEYARQYNEVHVRKAAEAFLKTRYVAPAETGRTRAGGAFSVAFASGVSL